jgi:hypothetical protein
MPELTFTADPAPATPIGDRDGWHIHIQCGRCWRHVVLPLGSLAESLGGRTRVIVIGPERLAELVVESGLFGWLLRKVGYSRPTEI